MVNTKKPQNVIEREDIIDWIIGEWVEIIRTSDEELASSLLRHIAHFESINDDVLVEMFVAMNDEKKKVLSLGTIN